MFVGEKALSVESCPVPDGSDQTAGSVLDHDVTGHDVRKVCDIITGF